MFPNNVETKTEHFLFRDHKRQMAVGEFVCYRNVGRDADVIKLVSQLQEKTAREDGMFMIYYAQRRIYTVSLEFDWHPDAPSYYTNLETYWDMVQDGRPEEECYLFYIDHCHNVVGNEWQAALEAAQKIWTPPEEGWSEDQPQVDEDGRIIELNEEDEIADELEQEALVAIGANGAAAPRKRGKAKASPNS